VIEFCPATLLNQANSCTRGDSKRAVPGSATCSWLNVLGALLQTNNPAGGGVEIQHVFEA